MFFPMKRGILPHTDEPQESLFTAKRPAPLASLRCGVIS